MDNEDTVILLLQDQTEWIRVEASKKMLISKSEYFRAMFSSAFAESTDSTVKLQGIQSPQILKNILVFLETGEEINDLNQTSVFDYLECAGMLQIVSLIQICSRFVISNLSVENVIDVFKAALHLMSEDLFSKATQFLLQNFSLIDSKMLEKLNSKEIHFLLTHEHLLIRDSSDAFSALDKWVDSDAEHRQPLKMKLSKSIESVKRKIPRFPCCVGRFKKLPYIFLYNLNKDKLEPFVSLKGKATSSQDGDVTATGFQVFSTGLGNHQFYVLGGEFGQFGRGKWNLDVWKYDTVTREFTKVFELDEPVRHFSTASSFDQFYVIGGFGRHRIILDSVRCYDQKSSTLTKPLPFPMYSVPAFYHEKLYVLKNSSQMWYYEIGTKSWEKAFDFVHFPVEKEVIEFSFALHCEGKIYVSARHQHKLYSFPLNSEERVELTEIGSFKEETQNLTLVDSVIYNFSSDQFDYMSSIESYDIHSGTFNTLFTSEDQNIDFSPYYSFGCFSLSVLPKYEIPSFAYKCQDDDA